MIGWVPYSDKTLLINPCLTRTHGRHQHDVDLILKMSKYWEGYFVPKFHHALLLHQCPDTRSWFLALRPPHCGFKAAPKCPLRPCPWPSRYYWQCCHLYVDLLEIGCQTRKTLCGRSPRAAGWAGWVEWGEGEEEGEGPVQRKPVSTHVPPCYTPVPPINCWLSTHLFICVYKHTSQRIQGYHGSFWSLLIRNFKYLKRLYIIPRVELVFRTSK